MVKKTSQIGLKKELEIEDEKFDFEKPVEMFEGVEIPSNGLK